MNYACIPCKNVCSVSLNVNLVLFSFKIKKKCWHSNYEILTANIKRKKKRDGKKKCKKNSMPLQIFSYVENPPQPTKATVQPHNTSSHTTRCDTTPHTRMQQTMCPHNIAEHTTTPQTTAAKTFFL